MNKGPTSPLENFSRIFNGKTPSKLEQRPTGHPVLKIRDVNELGAFRGQFQSFVDIKFAKQFSEKKIAVGDTLILNAAHNADYVGSKTFKACSGVAEAIPTGEWLVIRPNAEFLDSSYLHHWVNHPESRRMLRDLVKGIHLYPRDVARLPIAMPSLAEQKRISAILDAADGLRAKRRTTLTKLNELGKAIFLEMFGDLSSNPNKWPIVTIGDLLTSANYGTSAKAGFEGAWPVLRMNNITYDGAFDFSNLKYMELPDHEKSKYTVKKGDILFNRTNSPELVGKTAVFWSDRAFAFAGYLIRLRVNECASPEYISGYLNSRFGKKTLRNMCKSIVGMANINATEVQGIKIPKPPIGLQQKYSDIIRIIETQRSKQLMAQSNLELAFASLQHRAFKGEL